MIKRIALKLLLFFFLLVIAVGVGGGLWLYQQIVKEPGEEIKLSYIQGILGRESQVFYRDGKTPLGVFFDTAHRQYISFTEIPENFVNALVASEDSRFFHHYGFDVQSIVRATIKNLKAGRVVQGGSTLTQQTAKNLFKRKDRSFEAKFKELLMALKLEYYYSKEQIFEFYANQFYVSGNGVGLGVAARYYFDKTPAQLSLVECAFIAGSVNRPNYYNPFRKKTEKGKKRAVERAQIRLGYVLKEMRKLGMIDEETYEKAQNTPITFKQGKVGYSFDYVMEMVKEAVSSDDVLAALARHDIDNIATSGVRIITNIDQLLQRKTLAVLRYRLGITDVMLRGYERAEVQQELAALEHGKGGKLAKDVFSLGTIKAVSHNNQGVRIDVQLDGKAGEGYITAKGLQEIVSAWVKYKKRSRYAEPGKGDIARFLKELQQGDRIWAQVIGTPGSTAQNAEHNGEGGEGRPPVELRLARYPQLQGGAVVVQQGKIRAVAGGTENRFFNRAIDARRTMGSAFKPLVYAAAIQLGWNSADLLYNARSPYDYQKQIYFPRPDHHNPNTWVSMNWAGVRSENLATIWLLSRLCDKLTPLQFKEVAQQVGLAPQQQGEDIESYTLYSKRLRDEVGVVMTTSRLREAAYHMALSSLEADFLFAGLEGEFNRFINLPYGARFLRYEEEIDNELEEEESERKRKELAERKEMLQKSFLKLEEIYPLFFQAKREVTEALETHSFFGSPQPVLIPVYKDLADGSFHFRPFHHSGDDIPGMIPFSGKVLVEYLQAMDEAAQRKFWENIYLNGIVSVRAFVMVQNQARKEYAKLLSRRPYEFDILQHVEEFRIAVGLHYMVQLCQKMGIQSELAPVLSFPLGSNVVTPFELTRAYESLVTGSLTTFGSTEESVQDRDDAGLLAVIDRIESAEGEILYTPQAKTSLIIDEKSRLETNSILENVVRFGTGRYAHQHVRFRSRDEDGKELNSFVTLLGKTGTANNYTNSSFFGFVPVAAGSGTAMTLRKGYAIGVYCGYDDNRPMKNGRLHISGSSGALPIWSGIADTIINQEKLVVPFAHTKGASLSYFLEDNFVPDEIYLEVDREEGGLPLWRANQNVAGIRTLGRINRMGFFVPERHFTPFWSWTKKDLPEGGNLE